MALTEGEIHNLVGSLLRQQDAEIAQLVRPGGQALRSITFVDEGRRRTCYPDLLASVRGEAIIGELKPRYSASDYLKLRCIARSDEARRNAIRIINVGGVPERFGIKFVLCHSQAGSVAVEGVEQWIFAEDGGLTVVEAL